MLANQTLDGLEKRLNERYPKPKSGYNAKVNFVRYGDDFIVTGMSKELLEKEVKPLVEQFMRERELTLSPEKTVITHIEEGFDFLGQKEIFNSVDDAIYQLLRRWVKRRHPKKSKTWIEKKYFTTIGGDNWVFYGEVDGKTHYLMSTTSIPINRHVKVQGKANLYDPAWESSYEKRLEVHMEGTLKGKQWLLHLWKEQNGLCPVCNHKITKITGWHSHHILWKSRGGPDTAQNRVLLHPNCHQHVHSQGLHVEKPRPAKGVRKA